MSAILRGATRTIAALTIILAVLYFLFFAFAGPERPNPGAPTFADVRQRLEAGETTDMRTVPGAGRPAMEKRMNEGRAGQPDP